MTKPVIGILANQRLNKQLDNTPLTYVPTGFIKVIQDMGGIPLIIPMSCQKDLLTHYVNMVDKLILIGGQHVSPELYGQEKSAIEEDYSQERDDCELKIIDLARQYKKPLFTVCRGTQLVNVALGGDLNQDIPNHWVTEQTDQGIQDILVETDSQLATIYGKKARVNSLHQQSINQVAPGLRVIARDPKDQTIEAIESTDPNFKFLGVQWHPELMQENSPADRSLFDYIVNDF